MKLMQRFLSVLMLISCCGFAVAEQQEIRLSQPVVSDEVSETFGQALDLALPNFSLAELSVNSDKYLDKDFIVETRIAKVCQKKGCFFIAQEGQHHLRVAFKDYGFFVPSGSSGKTVTIEGRLIQRELSEKQAAHFQSDLKADPQVASQTVKPGVVYEIVASGVKIPKAS